MIAEVIIKVYKLTSLLLVQAVILAACVLTNAAANAATYYVATTGNDSNPGTFAQPFRTIQKGTSSLQSGDTLYLRGGTYDQEITSVFPGGSSGAHTIISGYASENPVLRPTTDPGGVGYLVFNFNAFVTYQNFTIDVRGLPLPPAGQLGGTNCMALYGNNLVSGITCIAPSHDGIVIFGDNITVRNSLVQDCGAVTTSLGDTKGIGIHGSGTNVLVEGNIVEGCRAGGIALHQGAQTNVTVRNNIIRNFGTKSTWPQTPGGSPQYGTGITFGHGTNYYAYNNLIYAGGNANNGAANQCFLGWGDGRGGGSYWYFYNNTCHDMDVGVQLYDIVTNMTARNNIFSNMGRVDLLGTGANNTNSNYATNPVFVNPAAGNFHLKPGSPGIGLGVNLSSVFTTDLDGVSRGSSYDIGAYQYVSSGAVSRPSTPVNLQVGR